MKFPLMIISILFIFSVGAASVDSANIKKSALVFDSKSWDFGSVPVDFKIAHSYKFKNTGEGDLHITKVDPNCDCTSVSARDTLIQPGDSSEIKVVFHTREFYGMTNKRVFIYADDPENPITELDYTANVEFFHKLHTSEPKYLTFLQVQNAKDVKLINNSDNRVGYVIQKEPDTLFSISKLQGSLSGEQFELINVKIKDNLSKGTYFTNFTVTYDTNPKLRLTIPVKIVRW